ncbi:MAG: PEP-CTERM sorting domain-containing protein [Planctomycetaceae bacterium]|nr:PEP-CTERM sorting domain-containing protein [Planctomycetaceae bacterium]
MIRTSLIRTRALAAGCCAAALLALASAPPAAASLLESPSLKLMQISSFTGTINPISVPFGDGFISTGPISLALDPSAINLFGLDNVYEAGYIDVTLILSSPLLSFLGENPKIRIIEEGPTSVGYINPPDGPSPSSVPHGGGCDCGCDPGFDFFFYSALTGGGTVQDGAFAGAVFHNVNAYQGQGMLGSWIVKPNTPVAWTINSSATVTFPGGYVAEGVGGRGTLTVVPEPSSFVLAALGLAGAWCAARRRK